MAGDELKGGRPGVIRRSGDKVIRPAGPWTTAVHSLLLYLRRVGFLEAPEPLGLDGKGNEILSFVEGEVFNPPPPGFFENADILRCAAELLRRFHDAQEGFEVRDDAAWMHGARYPADVICHGDFAPYNIVFREGLPAAIIDFDVAHPAPRIWDIAYALYRWVPCGDPALSGERGPVDFQAERIRLFLDAYGLERCEWAASTHHMIERLEVMTRHMRLEADAGNETFRAHIERGDLDLYLGDIAWLKANSACLTAKVAA